MQATTNINWLHCVLLSSQSMLIWRPAIRVLLATLVAAFLFICYGRTHFYRDPGSVFYDRSRAFERTYSLHREAEAKEYIRTLQAAEGVGSDGPTAADLGAAHVKAGVKPAICGIFSTVKREGEQYVETAIASLLHGLTPAERADIHLSILFAHTNSTAHPSLKQPWLLRAIDSAHTYTDTLDPETIAHLRQLEETRNYAEKGVFDYIYALKQCYDTQTPYIAMLEDDILFADGWLVRSLLGLRRIEAATTTTTTTSTGTIVIKPWLYMRLFNQERSTGWANKHIFGNNEHWIILAIAAVILTPTFLIQRRRRSRHLHRSRFRLPSQLPRHKSPAYPPSSPSSPPTTTITTILTLTLLTLPTIIILFFQAGKASMLPPRAGVVREAFGCCSQAMVFPRERVGGVMAFLEQRGKGQVDLLLNDLVREGEGGKGLDAWALYPVQVQHVGSQSVRGTTKKEAQAVWSMAFEDLKADKLRREHKEMVGRYYV
ncbi:hypothetical protein FQN50_006916 [Emmonsiellopsis sp. PD_5]|nr:hypothetical protein FQN50_006916 [Emmonsiellopsis sp. PD_5]